MNTLSPKHIQEQLMKRSIVVLDVRSEEKFAQHHLEHDNAETINIPKQVIFAAAGTDQDVDMPFSKDTEVIVTCTTGNSAGKCAKILNDKGYRVTLLEGGMTAWNEAFKS